MNTISDTIYDYIIIGAGPAGLTSATILSELGKKILIVEKNNTIGGCHTVKRVNVDGEMLFTEHGPRIYSKTYKTFIRLLKLMNMEFDDYFTPLNISITTIGNTKIMDSIKTREIFLIFLEFMKFVVNPSHGTKTSMKQFLTRKKFSHDSIDMIDRICRLTDGVDISRYTLYKFLQLVNIQAVHGIYQPKAPLDVSLFKDWEKYLSDARFDITILKNSSATGIKYDDDNKLMSLKVGNQNEIPVNMRTIQCKNIISAIPLVNLVELLNNSQDVVKSSFGSFEDLAKYSVKTNYNNYLSITFHWKHKLKLPDIFGFPKSEWALAFVVLSDYMDFVSDKSKTVISISVTKPDYTSSVTNKTAEQSAKDELFVEILRQLEESFGKLPTPDAMLLSPGVKKDPETDLWKSRDTAFIKTHDAEYISSFSVNDLPIYNVGTQNGKSYYPFTSFESAVSNAVDLCRKLTDDKTILEKYKTESSFTLRQVILVLVLILVSYIIIKKYKK